MRLSEAIMMGSATCRMLPGNINSCAYGAALNAQGIPTVSCLNRGYRYREILRLWPWTARQNDEPGAWYLLSSQAAIVFRKFDVFVCNELMTLEQLVDYVRSIEPDCDCNRFNCDCATKQPVALEAVYETSPQASR